MYSGRRDGGKKSRGFKCRELTVWGAVKRKRSPVKDFRNKDFHFVLLKNLVRKIRYVFPSLLLSSVKRYKGGKWKKKHSLWVPCKVILYYTSGC